MKDVIKPRVGRGETGQAWSGVIGPIYSHAFHLPLQATPTPDAAELGLIGVFSSGNCSGYSYSVLVLLAYAYDPHGTAGACLSSAS